MGELVKQSYAFYGHEKRESGVINGYHLLTKSVARQAYNDMYAFAKHYYSEVRKHVKVFPDEVAAKRRFNSIANWFYQGGFSLWYTDEIGQYLISKAKQTAYKRVFHKDLHDEHQTWKIKLTDELGNHIETLELSGDYKAVRDEVVKEYGDMWRVKWENKCDATWIRETDVSKL